jgi:L-lactate dehydrogenase complex protein LldG
MPVHADPKEKLFMERPAQKLGRPTPQQPPSREVSGPPDFWLEIKPDREELLRQFVINAEKLTVKCHVVTDKTQVPTVIGQWFAEIQAHSVMSWDSPQLTQLSIAEACQASGANLLLWNQQRDRQEMIQQCASVDAGITWVDYAIANTGTLAILSNQVQSRAVSLLPPVHIAVLHRDNILPHMGDIFAKLDHTALPSSLTFITGPSRTSDIEMDLTLGVHGPGKVFVLIVDLQIL